MTATTGDIKITSQSVHVDRTTQTVKFTIDFGSAPDFFTVDEVGRPADSFQYYIDVDAGLPVVEQTSQLDIIIRGDEVSGTNQIVIRNDEGDGGANSGGWGPIRGSVPFNVNGSILSFTVPLALLGDTDGRFSYNLQTIEFGGQGDFASDLLSFPSILNGTNRADNLVGTLATDEINGFNGQDTLSGQGGNDNLCGGNGQDRLEGGGGKDILHGGNGDDVLIGSDGSSFGLYPYSKEGDVLTGGKGQDTFVLGESNRIYYAFFIGDVGRDNYADYALVTDFQADEVIQLRGPSNLYQLRENFRVDGRTGTAIILQGGRFSPPNLIGLVEGVSGLNLTSSNFRYV